MIGVQVVVARRDRAGRDGSSARPSSAWVLATPTATPSTRTVRSASTVTTAPGRPRTVFSQGTLAPSPSGGSNRTASPMSGAPAGSTR